MRILTVFLFAAVSVFGQNTHSVTLSCTASASTGVTGYNFFRATVSGGPYTQIDSVAPTTCAFVDGPATTFTEGATYYYVATAIGNGGTQSVYSNEAKAVIPFLPPTAPTSLSAAPK
jgi:fibronectin type 3 domain-containing protein